MPLFGRTYPRLPLMESDRATAWPGRAAPATRVVACPHCGDGVRVAVRAINTRCTGCMKHLMLEDVVVRGDSVRSQIIT